MYCQSCKKKYFESAIIQACSKLNRGLADWEWANFDQAKMYYSIQCSLLYNWTLTFCIEFSMDTSYFETALYQ